MSKEKKKGKRKVVLTVVLSIVLVLTIVADVAVFAVYPTALDKAFPAATGDAEKIESATQNALQVAQEIEEEGAVLLENNGVLPMNDSSNAKINLLGYSSISPIYGGTGSGGSSFLDNRVDLVTAFTEAGFEVNDALTNMYASNKNEEKNTFEVDFSINEPAATKELATDMGQEYKYTEECSFDSLKEYSDTAVIVVSRKGGEGNDLPVYMNEYTDYEPDKEKHYLELNSAEQSLIAEAKENFGTVIVLINAGNAMELGFLENEKELGAGQTGDIDAALWIGDIGDVGAVGVANILKGIVNPSGKLADIYPYAIETIPSYYNFDTYEYTNSAQCFEDFDSHPAYLLEYQEGIYVGYRYYETRDSYDYTTREGEAVTGVPYEEVVQYPFGYGLSYSHFTWNTSKITEKKDLEKGDVIEVEVEVTNTGDTAGKDVVELYYTPPYYADGSKIQKSDVVLGGYAKTEEIAPGEKDTVTIQLNVEDMASFDDLKYYSSTGAYVLESGDYVISLRSDSHTVVDDMEYTYNLQNTIVFADETAKTENGTDAQYVGKRADDEAEAVNQFDDVAGDVAYLSRDTWEVIPGTSKEATKEQLEAFETALELDESFVNEDDEAPVFGKKGNLTIKDLKGKSYDDPMWDELLDQLTLEEIDTMVANNGWGSAAVESVGKNQIYDMDGPAALSYVFDAFMGTCTYKTVTYPCEVVTASSWNTAIAEKFGDAISKEGEAWAISGWYAPGANMHRNPFTGRNFEYYSEDAYLAGTMATAAVSKAQENGMYCYMKHFALNERETYRHSGLCTWANEQSMREIYLKPFEMAVKDGGLTAMMSSYNNLGVTWAGESKALLTHVLRGEWGFKGTVLTDNNEEHGFMNPELAIAAGGTALLYNGMNGAKSCERLAATASGQKLLREAAHQYLYTVANSYATELTENTAPWRIPAMAGSAVLYIITIGGLALIWLRKQKN